LLAGTLPANPHNRERGYAQGGVLANLLIVLIVLMISRRI